MRARAHDLLGVVLLVAGVVVTAGATVGYWPGLFSDAIDYVVSTAAGVFIIWLGCDILNR